MISVVIPCYNEADWIEKTHNRVKKELEKLELDYEIILEQDGSTDGTDKIIKNIAKKHKNTRAFSFKKRRGKGFGLKFCFGKAKGDIIMMDADLAAGIGVIEKFLKTRGDIIIATGYERGVNKRGFLSLLYKSLVLVIFGLNLDYIQSGFKMIRKNVINNLDLEIKSMAFDTELVLKANKQGYKIKEIKTSWNQRKKRSFGTKQIGKMFIDLFRIGFGNG